MYGLLKFIVNIFIFSTLFPLVLLILFRTVEALVLICDSGFRLFISLQRSIRARVDATKLPL